MAIQHSRWVTGSALALAVAGCASGEDGALGTANAYRTEAPAALKGTVATRELAPQVSEGAIGALVASNTEFALSFFEQVSAAAPGENTAFGAYSVSQVMAMVYAGARGQTAAEMETALHYTLGAGELHAAFNGLDSQLGARAGEVLLRNANQVWMQAGFDVQTDFLDVLTRDYGAPLAPLDIASDPEGARAQINRWVAEATEQRIAELLPEGSVNPLTVMVLSNAMYLDAPWRYPFPLDATSDAAFSLADGTAVQVATLNVKAPLPLAEGEGWQAVSLPYRGDELSMLVVVPSDLPAFEASLSAGTLATIRGQLAADQDVRLSMPRFTLNAHVSLEAALRAIGLESLFESPDLSGIADRELWLGAVEHEAFVEVSERGTRASAATAATVQTRSVSPSLVVDRPFLFFVIDEPTGSVLFLGKVMDPR